MYRIALILGILLLAATLGSTIAAAGTTGGKSFAWVRDADGDGVPNGMDADWTRPEDGTGYQMKHGFGLVLTGLFARTPNAGYLDLYRYRHRFDRPDAAGDQLRIQMKLRDGSCE